MTTARQIISGTLRFHLNRLSPGETLDADLADVCLEALNSIADEMNGDETMLWRQVLTAGTVSGTTGTLGSTWATLSPGDQILGASYSDGGQDIPLCELTLAQYQALPVKTTGGQPQYWSHDGQATVYFYPAPTGVSVTLRTGSPVSDFADLDTDYVMPRGRMAAFQALLAERLAPSMIGDVTPAIARASKKARLTLKAGAKPAIISSRREGNILTGF